MDAESTVQGSHGIHEGIDQAIDLFLQRGADIGFKLGRQVGREDAQQEIDAAYKRGTEDALAEIAQAKEQAYSEGLADAEAEYQERLKAAEAAAFQRGQAYVLWQLQQAAVNGRGTDFSYDPDKQVPMPLFYGRGEGPGADFSATGKTPPPMDGSNLSLDEVRGHGVRARWSTPSQTVAARPLGGIQRLRHYMFPPLASKGVTEATTVGEFIEKVPLAELVQTRGIAHAIWGDISVSMAQLGIKVEICVTP